MITVKKVQTFANFRNSYFIVRGEEETKELKDSFSDYFNLLPPSQLEALQKMNIKMDKKEEKQEEGQEEKKPEKPEGKEEEQQ